MARTIRDVMTRRPQCLPAEATAIQAARMMREHDIGDVLVIDDDGAVCGIVTDRDIVIRSLAAGLSAETTRLGDICSRDLCQLSPDDDITEAIRLMARQSIRRLPVIDGGRPVGIVSLGDLAESEDPDSALGEISAAPPTH